MGERWQRIATFGVGAAFCAACVALVGQSFRAVLSVDEGYNLEVVDTLARTGVYASYGSHRFDAAWSTPRSWGQLAQYLQQVPPEWPFDPRVTTGPAVLVPLAAAYALTDRNIQVLRGVMWGFWLLALAALWRLTPRGEHRLLGFFSATAIFCTLWFGFHPSAVLGEVPAAAYFLWGCWALGRGLPLLSGLFWGLAVQAKFIMLPAVAAGVGVAAWYARRSRPLGTAVPLMAGVAFPLLAFEVYRLAVLGSGEAWLASWGEFRAFSAEQSGPWALRLVGEKLHSLHVTGPGLALGTAWALALAVRLAACPAGAPPQPGAGAVLPALWLGGVATWALWFGFSAQASYRQGLPGAVLLYAAGMLTSRWWALRTDASFAPWRRLVTGAGPVSIAVLLAVSSGQWAYRVFTFTGWEDGFRGQVAAAQALVRSGAAGISPQIRYYEPFPFLTGLPVALCPTARHALVATLWAHAIAGKPREEFRELCGEVIAENQDVLICFPRAAPTDAQEVTLAIDDWGPRETRRGVVPNRQPSGDGAFWFTLQQPPPLPPNLFLVLGDAVAGPVTWSADGAWFSALLPARLVRRPGSFRIRLWEACGHHLTEVGDFHVRGEEGAGRDWKPGQR